MNLEQFSSEFDIAYNNITSNASPPLNEFEKSSFLTKAQNELLLIYYNGLNGRYTSFESTEECRRYLDSLVVHESPLTLKRIDSIERFKLYIYEKPKVTTTISTTIDDEPVEVSLDQLLFIVRDSAMKQVTDGCVDTKYLSVKAVNFNDLTHILQDPFKCPNGTRALRIDFEDGIGIITSETLQQYYCTYIRKPKPIILEDITDYGLNIEGYQTPQTPVCEFPDVMHQKIIDRAVLLAKAAYVGDLSSQAALSTQTI